MTITKNSTNYDFTDQSNNMSIAGTIRIYEGGEININAHAENGANGYYSKDVNGNVSFSCNFQEPNDMTDYMQTLVTAILAQLPNEAES